jgi:flagellar M-ring protein FliF
MALVDGEMMSKSALGFSQLPIMKQIGILFGLAATIAIGVSVALWSQEAEFSPLYSGLPAKDASEVLDVLGQNNMKYKYDSSRGTILVATSKIHDARLKLAEQGLPNGDGFGFEILGTKGGFGDSQFLEVARYRQALSGELARTISNFRQVKSARVHLAIPKQSAFIRDKKRPSASVFIDMYSGASLGSNSVEAIVHLVSSSVPGMRSQDVTVVDDHGQLLTNAYQDEQSAVTDRMLKFRHQIEKAYSSKIQDILQPLLGHNKVRARVTAEVDFTSTEQTSERYNPDMPAIRSESMLIERKGPGQGGGKGAPGSLANQPPAAIRLESGASLRNDQNGSSSNDTLNQSTRNYEVDKTTSYTKHNPGQVRRITVAVVVDDKVNVSKSGKVTKTALDENEIAQVTNLVKNAIGFDPARGDSVEVINKSFADPLPVEIMPPMPIWKQSWFIELIKQLLGGSFILIILFGVVKPLLKTLAVNTSAGGIAVDNIEDEVIDETTGLIPDYADPMKLPDNLQTPEARMHVAHELAADDPKRVAQVVKNWVDGGS